jgi:hypothetical protein
VPKKTLGKGSVTVTWRRDGDFSLPSAKWHSANSLPSARQKVLGKEVIADVQFVERSLSSVTLGKAFAECNIAFAECLRHSAKEQCPVVKHTLLSQGGFQYYAQSFNTMRRAEDKSNGNFYYRWPHLFNAIIENLELREIDIVGRQFTWANDLVPPTIEKLDRVLMTLEWERKFPNVTVQALDRYQFDHTPLSLNGKVPTCLGNHSDFKFELGWLIREGFYDMVSSICQQEYRGGSAIQIWQNKIRALRRYLRGWAKNSAESTKKEKKQLLELIDNLDKKAEISYLSPNELSTKAYGNDRLVSILREEEVRLFQRAKVKTLLEEDDNTNYFQLVANGKHRRQRIYSL